MSLFLLDNTLINGTLSSTGTHYDLYGNSGQWNSVYSTFNTQSANNASVYTTFNGQSANNASVYTTTQANSAAWTAASGAGSGYVTWTQFSPASAFWQSNYSTTNANSANWQSVYAFVNSTSAAESNQNSVFATVCANSASWQSVYASFNSQSARHESVYATFNSQSANNASVYSLTQSKSAAWDAASSAGSGYVTWTQFSPASAFWQSNYSTTNSFSANWQSVYSTFNTQSANNASVYTTFNTQSANNASVYSTVRTNSAAWGSFNGTNFSKAVSSIGNGVATSFAYAHNLNTNDIHVMVYDNGTKSIVTPTLTITNVNTVTLGFAVAPTSNQYRVVVMA